MKKVKSTIAALAMCGLMGLSYPSVAQDPERDRANSTMNANRNDDHDDEDHGKWGLAGLLGLLGLAGLRKKDPDTRYTTTGTPGSVRRND
jgi:MYXO-CTERM domain-containing protein